MSALPPENTPVIVGAVRTPIGRFRGALKDVRADDLAAVSLRALVERTAVPVELIDDVVLGCANQAGEDNRNVARMALLLAGLPQSVPGATVNRLCGSGLEALLGCARAIRAGEGEVFIAGGVENMTRAPYSMPKAAAGFPNGNLTVYDTSLGWRYPNPKLEALFPLEAMGETAENLVERYHLERGAQDAFALHSHDKAVAAQAAGAFADELCPVEIPQGKGKPPIIVAADEGPRAGSTLEALGKLPPVFRKGGSVTAGNSSGLNDGSAAILIMSAARARALGMTPLARVVAGAAAGVDPRVMGIGPVPATQKALARAGWSLGDVELCELNEAFASQSMAVLRELPIPAERVNVNGGAIALGHPLGCSGARIVTTLVHAMRRRRAQRGLATMCIGVGQGIAALFEAP
jgi:3-oxoadipyl-CoA thiolase